MKIYNIENPDKFLELINKCKGTVELVSKQGDRLNLKSELTKFLTVTKLFTETSFINELELVASEPEDIKMLLDYMMEGK